MNTHETILPTSTTTPLGKPRRSYTPKEWKIVPIRECPLPEQMHLCDTPEKAAAYWQQHIPNNPYFDPERECFVVLLLNSRRRIRGHQFLSMGTMDTLLIHPRDVFRLAIVANAAAILVMHNHPSGESSPSDADIRATRELIKAGQLLKIELLDHVIVGAKPCSLRSLGYFH
jgi:DNA repair protein RadC